MTDQEIRQIRKRITPDLKNLKNIQGCYVNAAREKVSTMNLQIPGMEAEEKEMYSSVLKKMFSGQKNKNILEVKTDPDSEEAGILRNTAYSKNSSRDILCDRIIGSYDNDGKSYVILTASDAYDLPRRREGGDSIGEDVFSYMLCLICPVKEPKGLIRYKPQPKEFRGDTSGSILQPPVVGFMYPTLDEGQSNESCALFYTKDPKTENKELIETLFAAGKIPVPSEILKERLGEVMHEGLGNELTMRVLGAVNTRILEGAENPDDPSISLEEIRTVIEAEGVSDEALERFDESADDLLSGHEYFDANSLCDKNRYEIKTSESVITTVPENAARIRTRKIDGVTYLLVPAGNEIRINGVPVVIGEDR